MQNENLIDNLSENTIQSNETIAKPVPDWLETLRAAGRTGIEIHCSTLPAYADCPRRAAARIIRNTIEDAGFNLRETQRGVGAAFGSGFHHAANVVMRLKIDGNEADRSAAEEIAIQEMRQRGERGLNYDATTRSMNDAEKQMRTCVAAFFAQVEPQIQPVCAETRRPADIVSGVSLVGTSDVETVENSIDDYKTGSHLRMYHSQLGGYSLLKKSHGGTVAKLRKHFIPRVPVSKPYPGTKTIEYPVDVSERAAWSVIQHIQRDVRIFVASGNPDSFLANPMSMMCSEKYCVCYGTAFCELTKGV